MCAADPSDRQKPDHSSPPRAPARAARSPESGTPPDRPGPEPLPDRPPPAWTGPPPEFEDEEPGAYLEELGVRGWNVVWATLNLLITLWVGLYGSLVGISSEWQFLVEMAWNLLPLSGGVLLVITFWQKASAYTKNAPGKSRWTLLLSFVALVLWFILGGEFVD